MQGGILSISMGQQVYGAKAALQMREEWAADTLTEDLDLSYHPNAWLGVCVSQTVETPAELLLRCLLLNRNNTDG